MVDDDKTIAGAASSDPTCAGHYLDLDPEAGRWFVVCGHDDPAGVMAAMGLATPGAAAPSHGHLWSHAATMVAAVTSIIGGVGAALVANALGAGRVPVAASATVGAVVTVMSVGAFGWHQLRRWRTAEASVPSLFPSQPGQAAGLDPLPTASSRRPEGSSQTSTRSAPAAPWGLVPRPPARRACATPGGSAGARVPSTPHHGTSWPLTSRLNAVDAKAPGDRGPFDPAGFGVGG